MGFAPFFIDSIKREVRRRTTEQHGDTALHATVFLGLVFRFHKERFKKKEVRKVCFTVPQEVFHLHASVVGLVHV